MHTARYLAVDVGAGNGTRLALYDSAFQPLEGASLNRDDYGPDYATYRARVLGLAAGLAKGAPGLRAAGIASAGIMRADGSFQLAANIPFLTGRNLRRDLSEALGVPAGIANDADAGALAEWSARRGGLLSWVFGGGWGGAWVDAAGHVRFPTIDWDGVDSSLHPSNEPGYSIPLPRQTVERRAAECGVVPDTLLGLTAAACGGVLPAGPDGDRSSFRAELFVSGPGRWRLYQAAAAAQAPAGIDAAELAELADPTAGGRIVSLLSSRGDRAALAADRLFGLLLADCAAGLLERCRADGLAPDAPVALSGKPALALEWFGPSCRDELTRRGLGTHPLEPSRLAGTGANPNLLGAAVLASQLIG